MLKRRKESARGNSNSHWRFILEPEVSISRCGNTIASILGDSDDNDTLGDQEIEAMEMATRPQDLSPPRQAFHMTSKGDRSGIPKFARSGEY